MNDMSLADYLVPLYRVLFEPETVSGDDQAVRCGGRYDSDTRCPTDPGDDS